MFPIQGEKIDRRDLADSDFPLLSSLLRVRRKLLSLWLGIVGGKFWKDHHLNPSPEFHRRICQSIAHGHPLAVGRLGGVEASILICNEGAWLIRKILHPFSETVYGARNAGIRPRNKTSYRAFANICRLALNNLDIQGVWRTPREAFCSGPCPKREFYHGEITGPDPGNHEHWLTALNGRRVLVVSPFKNTIQEQIPRLAAVWPKVTWMAGTEFQCVSFPYLIDEDCSETWWEVYNRIGAIVTRGDYDVALFGCGGLGLPFAHLAKKAGRVGIHLGGHVQLIFGIYGKRHLEQDWFKTHINEAWVRPGMGEVAKTASRVEGGCYW
jgi:hypothetical protein